MTLTMACLITFMATTIFYLLVGGLLALAEGV